MVETKTPQKTENGQQVENVREDYNLPKTKLKIVMPDVKPPKDVDTQNGNQSEDGKTEK